MEANGTPDREPTGWISYGERNSNEEEMTSRSKDGALKNH